MKLGSETQHKYSIKIYFHSFVDYHHLQSILAAVTSHSPTALTIKSILTVTLSGSAVGSIKCSYFDTIIKPILENCKWLKKLCANSANDHALQSSKVFF